MRIKKIVANSMPEAMKQIKKELGNNALILNSKEVKAPGILGFFGRKQIEVTAMLDNEERIPKKAREFKVQSDEKIKVSPILNNNIVNEARILDEIKHLQSILTKQSTQQDREFPPMLNNVYHYLIDQEVEQTLAAEIVQSILDEAENSELDRERVKELLHRKIEQKLANVSYDNIKSETKIVQFVGPTGVGKTTTIAKVAANSILVDKKSVAFITADTYRIAAIEQLKTYATILNVPIEIVYSQADYEQALQKFAKYDLVFVDTAGRNYRETQYIHELKQFITRSQHPTQTFLVLSLTAKNSDVQDIYEQFKQLQINQVIFTKVDETESYGSLFNLSVNEKLGIAYLTNGQNVPDDLLEANAKVLTDMLLRRYDNA